MNDVVKIYCRIGSMKNILWVIYIGNNNNNRGKVVLNGVTLIIFCTLFCAIVFYFQREMVLLQRGGLLSMIKGDIC